MDVSKVLKRKINYNIDFERSTDCEDDRFVEACCRAGDFILFISDESVRREDYFIIRSGNENIGICSFNIEERMGVKIARPIIYMSRRKNLNSFMAINSVAYYLFRHENIERLELRIFSNNKQMLSVADRGFFKYEGCIRCCKKINDEFVDMHFYSILKREFDLFAEY